MNARRKNFVGSIVSARTFRTSLKLEPNNYHNFQAEINQDGRFIYSTICYSRGRYKRICSTQIYGFFSAGVKGNNL